MCSRQRWDGTATLVTRIDTAFALQIAIADDVKLSGGRAITKGFGERSSQVVIVLEVNDI